MVIVESPVKARTIKRFLGGDYVVESCMGHVRDLPQSAKDLPERYKKESWASLGVDVDHGFEPYYCVPKSKLKVVKSLKEHLEGANELILATDEDREGESISWHLVEVLKPKVPVKRMVFHEITKEAISDALKSFRTIDQNLVRAQEARRILDRLVGYTLSPLIWKKVAYGLSGGRVQSVAVRLLVERELERITFESSKYWGVLANCKKEGDLFEARLVSLDGRRIVTSRDFDRTTGKLNDKGDLLSLGEEKAQELAKTLLKEKWVVSDIEEKPITRKPPPPFITSTLQQEANRKYGFAARKTMQVAQKLYERGFITYMRTDSTALSQQAITAARECVMELYGSEYLPKEARIYSGKKVKGAQEAHEAIRPAGTRFATPSELGLADEEFKLYDLIWKRTVASQMENCQQKQQKVVLQVDKAVFHAHGMVIVFPGFLRAYVEGTDDPEAALEERETYLPLLKVKEEVKCDSLKATDHETKPPPRFTEASLVQTMEKEGIGRPSTYATVIGTIIDRGYARKNGNALVPTFTAMVVSKLLSQHLPQYVDLGFTSQMESNLDEIAQGELEWTGYLKGVYFGKDGLKNQVEVQQKKIDPDEARLLKLPGLEELNFRVGRYGAYVCKSAQRGDKEICASLPDAVAPADLTSEIANKLIDQKINGADAIGKDPESGLPVYVLTGRYGPYVQLGDSDGEKQKIKRATIPPDRKPEEITLEEACMLLKLPLTLGDHPEVKEPVKVGFGRFGPYVVCKGEYRSIPKGQSLFEVTLDQALHLLRQPKGRRGQKKVIQELGVHPSNGEKVLVMDGKYGPYINCGKTNASLNKESDPTKVTLEEALALLGGKEESGQATKKSGKSSKKASGEKSGEKTVERSGKKVGRTTKTSKKGKKSSKATTARSSKDRQLS